MGYPRKSYPHRCSPPCAKRSRPRACARVYIIYRSPVGCSWECPRRCGEEARRCDPVSRAAERRVGEGEGKGGRTLAQCPVLARLRPSPCLPTAESLCAKAECTRQSPLLPVRSSRVSLSTAAPLPADGRSAERKGGSAQGNPRSCPCVLPAPACLRPCLRPLMGEVPCVFPAATCLRPRSRPLMGEAPSAGWGRAKAKADAPSHSNPPLPVRSPRGNLSTAAPPPPKWAPRLRRREGKRPNGAPPHRNAHTPNAERKRYLHNSRTKTQRRTKRCAQFVIFVFTPCKLLHNFSTVLHRSPRSVPERAQIAVRRPDFPCFTARFSPFPPESHCAKPPRTAPVLPPKNAPLRAYAKPRPHPRVRGTRQHATTCAFFTFSARYERIGGPPKTNFCPAEGRKWGRLWSQMLKNGLQTKKSTFSFGRLVI